MKLTYRQLATFCLCTSIFVYTLIPIQFAIASQPQHCYHWNLSDDFRTLPKPKNPVGDDCPGPKVWHLMRGTNLTRNAANYVLLDEFVADSFYIPGLNQWQGPSIFEPASPKNNLPAIGINKTGVAQTAYTILWEPNVVRVHPHPSELVIVGWRSPIKGYIRITGSFQDMDIVGGNGIAWFIDKDNVGLTSGAIDNGGQQSFLVEHLSVKKGDFVYFIVDPNGDVGYDSTALTVDIDALEED